MINIDIIEMAAANTSEIIMAVKILGAAEGLRPRAEMLENPVAAITIAAPTIQRAKTRTRLMLRSMTRDQGPGT